MLTIAQIAPLKSRDPYLYETLVQIVNSINLTAKQSGISPTGSLPTPPAIGAIEVTAANGLFDVALTDKEAAQAGIVYFVEFDTSPTFANAHVLFLGPSRNGHVALGNATYYWRAYSMYQASGVRSPIVVLGGSAPIGVAGGGGAAGPAPGPAQGSGTSQVPGFGFGTPPNRIPGRRQSFQ